jgi:hypothetical protein
LRGTGREHHGARELTAQIGIEDAQCGERTGRSGDENATNAEPICQVAGVKGSCATEGEQRKGTRVVAAFDRDAAKG